MAVKFSRRLVAEKIVDMLEADQNIKSVMNKLAAYLIENHQTRQAELYLRDIRRVLEERKSYLAVDVKSANELNETLKEQISDFMKNQTNSKEVEIISTVNPELISGVVISTTEAVYDGSLKNRIKKLRTI